MAVETRVTSGMLTDMSGGDSGEHDSGVRWPRRRVVAMVMTCAGIGAAVVHVIVPSLKIDSVTVVLLAVAVVPWLGDLFRSIELPGGARFEFRDFERRLEAAERTADAALVGGGPDARTADDTAAWEVVEALAAEYTSVRRELSSGAPRTHRMDQIFTRMVRATQLVRGFDADALLTSQDAGLRLATYARLYAMPDAAGLGALVNAVVSEPLAFSQYWGFRAVGKVVQDMGVDRVPLGVVHSLEDCRGGIPSNSDRVEALESVLALLRDRSRGSGR
ncbi:hypothetical protein ACWDGI_25375 [Streptomyces sp. NPDC001220]